MNPFIGVNYAPAHYPSGDKRNYEAEANVYTEMDQLKAAGFTTVRLYGDPGKVWVNVINAANTLGMQVVYEVALCTLDLSSTTPNTCIGGTLGGATTVTTNSVTQLTDVIDIVGATIFGNVVSLILVGNEVLVGSGTNSSASYITDAITAVNKVLTNNTLTIPVSSSIQADVLWDNDVSRTTVVDAFSKNAPLAINVYPFQWGVKVADAVSDAKTAHSIAWYLAGLKTKYPGRSIMITETGWATQGTDPNYASQTPGTISDAETYCQDLYSYVKTNKIPLLYFMAFDVPTKVPASPSDAENHYGVFTDTCALKETTANKPALKLLPDQSYSSDCKGCSANQAIFTFVGMNNTAQPSFTITYQLTSTSSSITLTVSTQNRANESTTPWPTITLQVGSTVTLSGGASGKTSTNTVASINTNHSGGTWGTATGDADAGVNWATGQNVFLPATF